MVAARVTKAHPRMPKGHAMDRSTQGGTVVVRALCRRTCSTATARLHRRPWCATTAELARSMRG